MKYKEAYFWLRREIGFYIDNLWVYVRYQLLTKGFLVLVAFPLVNYIIEILIKASGQVALSSGHYKAFFLSWQGLLFMLVGAIFLLFVVMIDINSFVVISAAVRKGQKITAIEAIRAGKKTMKKLISPAGMFLMAYLMLIVPLVGVGLKTYSIKEFKIPNFITAVIRDNPVFFGIYIILIIFLIGVGFFLILSFHFLQLSDNNALNSMKKSMQMVWRYKGAVLKRLLLTSGLILIFPLIVGWLACVGFSLTDQWLVGNTISNRFVMIMVLIIVIEVINVWLFLSMPLQIHFLTGVFYDHSDEKIVDKKNKKAGAEKRFNKGYVKGFLGGLLVLNCLAGLFATVFFEDIFRYRPPIDVIAHRAGGNLAAENTLLGLKAAMRAGARWSEIDIRRSRDGVYVVQHDKTFARLAGMPKRPSQMTWREIKKLQIRDNFNPKRPAGRVSDLNAFLEAAKGNIGLLLELKGADADQKMADDVVAMVRKKKMKKEVVLISMNYDLIQYIESKYPDITTGYLYFFAFGDTSKIRTDYLIMEQSAVKSDVIDRIHNEGKKALVWTVNSPTAISGLLDADVDGLITDNVKGMKKAIRRWDKQTDRQLIAGEVKKTIEKVYNFIGLSLLF